ncbi:MAG: hypothetical protein JST16_04055 [Bdellovibrionales bacterium]|nr:hypothetical protein [Bdellovibrionales bacterium]
MLKQVRPTRRPIILIVALCALALRCSSTLVASKSSHNLYASTLRYPASNPQSPSWPQLLSPDTFKAKVQTAVDRAGLTGPNRDLMTERVATYLAFLGVPPTNNFYTKNFGRILNASTQFLMCDVEDWGCLETTPLLPPSAAWRQETEPGLGQPVAAGATLDVDTFFSQRFNNKLPDQQTTPRTVAPALAERIMKDGSHGVSAALYGIDDIAGSLKPVFDALMAQKKQGSNVRAVVDVEMEPDANSFLRAYDVRVADGTAEVTPLAHPLIFSYIAPPSVEEREYWIFGRPSWMDSLMQQNSHQLTIQVNGKVVSGADVDAKWFANPSRKVPAGAAVRMAYQYGGNTQLMLALNEGITRDEDSKGRLEWPDDGIMHNKFFVMENTDGKHSVWTGTANVSQTCMGDEENANMSLYIRNDAIASAYQKEFEEMYGFEPGHVYKDSKGLMVNRQGGAEILVGRFHNDKRPNTKRYFTFDDGTELRVHFSPTDDAEHRAILPMLLSARAGDKIRIAMYGSTGLEYVRAIQYALAKGASVQIVLDNTTGVGVNAWINPKTQVKLQDPNPYVDRVDRQGTPVGKLDIRLSGWNGLNHLKVGTLTRKLSDGSERAEVIALGSQNWSESGNDSNDENMLTIRNRSKDLKLAADFNQFFDSKLWVAPTKAPNGF